MFNKKKKTKTITNGGGEKKTLLSQPEETYKSFVVNESLESNTKRHNLASYSTGHHEGMLEDDKLIEDQSMSTSNAKKRGSKKRDVYVRLHAKDINSVDAASATVQLQLTVYLTWEDKNYKNDKDGNLTVKLFDPEVEIFNEVKMKTDSVLEVLDPKRNLIRKKIHFSGTINTYMHLSSFPFDEHRVLIFIRPRKHWSNLVELKFQENIEQWAGMNLIGGSMSIGLPDWQVAIPELAMQTVQRRAYNPDDRCSQILVTIPMRRVSSYYVWKFFAVLALMTIMSWYTFKMDPRDFGDKMVINLTLFLSVVAFLFVIDKGLPKVPYFTIADWMMTGAFVFIFFAATQNFVVWLLCAGNNPLYLTVDTWSCIAFPVASLLYVLMLTLVIQRKKAKRRAVYPLHQHIFFRGRAETN